jgi:hypothetical protein
MRADTSNTSSSMEQLLGTPRQVARPCAEVARHGRGEHRKRFPSHLPASPVWTTERNADDSAHRLGKVYVGPEAQLAALATAVTSLRSRPLFARRIRQTLAEHCLFGKPTPRRQEPAASRCRL